jgi:hypothetical protein
LQQLSVVSNTYRLQINLLSLLSCLRDDCHKQAVLISKSHDDLNRCTPCRGKSDQYATRIPHSVRVWSQTIRISHGQRIATFHESPIDLDGSHCSREKGSRHNPQHAGRPIRGSVPSFSSKPTNEVVGLSQTSVVNKLLGLLGPYQQHAIGTFNTCSWRPTHRSLTDTGGGYSLEGAGFPRTTPRPSQSTVFHFHLGGPVWSPL